MPQLDQRRPAASKFGFSRPAMMRDLPVWIVCLAFSLAQWSHAAFFFGNDLLRSVQAEQGVIDGFPHWRVFQSRVLGPWVEKIVSLPFGSNLLIGHVVVAVVMLTLCGVVMFYAGRDIGGNHAGWSSLLAFQALFALTMARPWLYIWDYFVLLVAAAFLLLVIRRAPWSSFLLLMGIAFFNHESALFIGVWMVAKALTDAWAERRHPDWGMLAGGVLGSLAGILLTEFLRSALLVREIGWEIFTDMGQRPADPLAGYTYFHIQLFNNLSDIYRWIVHPTANLLFVKALPIVVALALAVILVLRRGLKAAPLAVYAITQVAALLFFALTSEARTNLQLVPFLCLGGMLAARHDAAPET
jgi:hypothetical protein